MQPREILETCLYVDNLIAAKDFYGRILGLQFVEEQPARHAFYRCGARMLLIFYPPASSQSDDMFPPHGGTGAGHVAFAAAETELDAWVDHLDKHQVAIEKDLRWPQGGRSIYFRDPAGNSLEIATPRIWGIPEDAALGR